MTDESALFLIHPLVSECCGIKKKRSFTGLKWRWRSCWGVTLLPYQVGRQQRKRRRSSNKCCKVSVLTVAINRLSFMESIFWELGVAALRSNEEGEWLQAFKGPNTLMTHRCQRPEDDLREWLVSLTPPPSVIASNVLSHFLFGVRPSRRYISLPSS